LQVAGVVVDLAVAVVLVVIAQALEHLAVAHQQSPNLD
jgi:hypothetical protein